MNAAEQLRVVAPNRVEHLDGIAELVGLAFGGNHPGRWRDRARAALAADDRYYSWNDSRIGLLGDRVVTHVGVVRYRMRLGRESVPVAGVSAVATHPYERGKGLMAETFSETVRGLRGAGYAMSILFGIDNFYHRFGYSRAWNESSISVRTAELPNAASPEQIREYPGAAWSIINPLYNFWNAEIPGSAVRFEDVPPPALIQGEATTVVWESGQAETPAGYLLFELGESDLQVLEQGGAPEAVLAVVRRVAEARFRRRVTFPHLSLASPLARRLCRGTCSVAVNPRARGGPMARTVNLHRCLEALAPELDARLRACPRLAGEARGLVISDGREEVGLRWDAGALRVRSAFPAEHRLEAGDHAATLVLGGDPPEDVLARPDVRVSSGGAAELVRHLFPLTCPMLSRADCF